MHRVYRLLSLIGISGMLTLAMSAPAFAHVIVTPSTVQTAARQVFNVSVPNEKDTPTTSITVDIPPVVQHVAPTVQAGWNVSANDSSITWSGGSIDVGARDDFSFSAQAPSTPTNLDWKAYQTYADGTVVSWDQPKDSKSLLTGTNIGPFSITKVVAELPLDPAVAAANNAATDAQSTADTALYVAIAGVIVGLGSIYFGLRRKQLPRKP